MSQEIHSLLDNEDADEEEGPFTDPSVASKKQKAEAPSSPKEGNIITRNKLTSLLLAIGIVLVLVISAVIIFFIVHNADKKDGNNTSNGTSGHENNTSNGTSGHGNNTSNGTPGHGNNTSNGTPGHGNNTSNGTSGHGNSTCGHGNDTSNDTSRIVIAPLNDHSSYKVLMLPNQLRVVLISYPNATEAAAAMNINAGSFNDPIEVDGLAHFCEHMLFLGTKKYPDKSEYSDFLSSNGGYDNAYTSTQNTNYYFSVNLDALEEALDRFAQFFIAPLFTANSTYKEMNAVNSEYDKDFTSPDWKLFQLTKNVSNPQHPFSRFSIGSIDTLNISNIRDKLMKYYTSSYSANQV